MKPLIYAALLVFFAACNGTDTPRNDGPATDNASNAAAIPPIISYTVVTTHPHDTSFFTEGLEYFNDQLLESSGGSTDNSPYPSAAGVVNPKTGKVDIKILLDKSKYFGEGITVFNNKIYMLTWESGVGFIYDSKTFKKIGEFKLPTREGWGLTHDSSSLIMSNGSNSLYYLDPNTLQVKNIMGVIDNNGPVANINELEYVNGYIYANQWQTPYILKIEASSGKVVGRIDLGPIASEIESKYKETYGLNGIAYNPKTNTLMIAGKKWPVFYEIRLQ
jgi:glutaminyl-peptide cyclotransferase